MEVLYEMNLIFYSYLKLKPGLNKITQVKCINIIVMESLPLILLNHLPLELNTCIISTKMF